MYQCTFFYQQQDDTPMLSPSVLSAWSVLTDKFYDYHTKDEKDAAFYPEDTYALIRTVEGSGTIATDNEKVHLSADEVVILKQHTIRYFASNSNIWKYNWVNFICTGKEIPPALLKDKFQRSCTLKEKELFEELLAAGTNPEMSPSYRNSVFLHYFYMLTSPEPAFAHTSKPLPIEEICSYIDQKYYTRLKVSDVANFFNISARRLNQIFHEQYHISPKKYIQNLKIEKAKMLLTQTTSHISEIADMLSFDSAYHFSAEFKKSTGITPTQYRSQPKKAAK